ncbi:MAG: hypothetical protein ACO27M_09895 [Vulcanococcus sp.]
MPYNFETKTYSPETTAKLPEGGELQIWSSEGSIERPDVFELTDGRIIKVHRSIESSGDRSAFAVSVLRGNYWTRERAYSNLEGSCGMIYCHRPSGAWELYPVERATRSLQRAGESSGIHCNEKATKRTAALQLVILSDELTRQTWDYCGHNEGHSVGNWRVKLLPIKASQRYGASMAKPGPLEISLVHDYCRLFVATNKKTGESCRIAVTRESFRGYREIRSQKLSLQDAKGSQQPCQDPPRSVFAHCESRCRI